MNTERLIEVLASGLEAVPTGNVRRQMLLTLLLGAAAAAVLMLAVYGLNPHLAALLPVSGFWIKVVFAGVLSVEAIAVLVRLARPGGVVGPTIWWIVASIAVLWIIGAATLMDAAAGTRAATVMGRTWRTCPFNIAFLSVPIFVASVIALRNLAPTRLRAAGAAVGFFSGAAGAFVYCFHCPEMAASFVGTWYIAGIAIPTIAGGVTGPRVLRW